MKINPKDRQLLKSAGYKIIKNAEEYKRLRAGMGDKTIPETLRGLRLMNSLLKDQNLEIQNNLNMRERMAFNSLATLSGVNSGLSPFAQTPLTSFNPMLQNNIYAPLTLDWTILMYAYKSHGLIQTLCDMPVLDAMRGGIEIRSKQLDEEEISDLDDVVERKGVLDVIATALIWTRLFGGGGLIVSTATPIAMPLDLKHLSIDGRLELYACNRWELAAQWRVPPDGHYNFYGKTIDASRVITMSGKEAPYQLRWQLSGWGMSELERCIEDFNTYIRIKNVIYELLYEAKVDVYKFKDFASQMLSAEAEAQTNRRMQIMNAQKNYNSALLLDKEDEFDQRQISFSGLAEIYRESRIELASTWRMPMTKLFGLPSTGLSTNEDDNEAYNGMIESEIRRPLRPIIRKVLEILCVMLFGDVPDDIDFEFKPLRVLGAKEEEEINTSKFNRMMMLYDRSLITPEELGQMLAKEKMVDSEIKLITSPDSMVEQLDLASMPERQVGLGKGRGGEETEE